MTPAEKLLGSARVWAYGELRLKEMETVGTMPQALIEAGRSEVEELLEDLKEAARRYCHEQP